MKAIKPVKFKSTLLINFVGIFLLVTIPTILTISIILSAYIKDVRSQYAETHGELLRKNQVAIDYQVDNLFAIPQHLLNVEEANRFLADSRNADSAQIANLLSGYRAGLDYVSDAVLFSHTSDALLDDHGEVLTPNSESQEIRQKFFEYSLPWYSEYRFYEHKEPFFTTTQQGAVWVCLPLMSQAEERLGLLGFKLDMTLLSQSIQSEPAIGPHPRRFYILTDYNRVLYSSAQGNAFLHSVIDTEPGNTRFTEDNSTSIVVSVSSVNEYGWKYALAQPDNTDAVAAQKTGSFLVTALLVAVVTNIIAALLITVFTYSPIREVLQTIEDPKREDKLFSRWLKSKEVNYIIQHIHDFASNTNRMEMELNQRLEQIRSAQTVALQTQINPHFLYNTLDTIRWLSIDESGADSKTSQMVESLAMMYRNTFYTENIIVKIRDELEFLSWYVDIIRIRFKDQIRFTVEVDPSLYDINCIKLSLQPIVENAIQHGLRKKHYVGNIHIYARQDVDKLHLFVEDDGQGMTQAEIREKNNALRNDEPTIEGRIGLSNVNERIKLIYGDEYGLTLFPREDGQEGLVVDITFPCN